MAVANAAAIFIMNLNFNTSHVKVYPYSNSAWRHTTSISIHLMLRFIGMCRILHRIDSYFNTSHVKVYQSDIWKRDPTGSYFNTSHVKVYPLSRVGVTKDGDFNTSHVKVYLWYLKSFFFFISISIHLMLRFISTPSATQYLRWLISIHLMLRFISISVGLCDYISHFNTSHVKVYRDPVADFFPQLQFQYISC